MEEKKEFKKAEVEVIRFEKSDVISTSTQGSNNTGDTGAGEGTSSGDGNCLDF